jgi:hypothetical protein
VTDDGGGSAEERTGDGSDRIGETPLRRRSVLASVAAVAGGALAGCGGSSSDTPTGTGQDGAETTPTTGDPTDGNGSTAATTDPSSVDLGDHSIRVRMEHLGSYTREPVVQSITVTEDGRLRYGLDCNERDGVEQTRTEQLDPAAHERFQRRVLATDVPALAGEYDCEGACPQDAGFDRIVVGIDGEEYGIDIDASAAVPTAVARLQERLAAFESRFERFDCTAADGTPTGERVAVTYRRPIGKGETRGRVTYAVTESGTFRFRLECDVDDGRTAEWQEWELDDDEYAFFERVVLAADPFSYSDRFECENCRRRRLDVRIDDRRARLAFPEDGMPKGIRPVVDELEGYAERFAERDCERG